jgi:hypothetical protein
MKLKKYMILIYVTVKKTLEQEQDFLLQLVFLQLHIVLKFFDAGVLLELSCKKNVTNIGENSKVTKKCLSLFSNPR